MLNQQEISKKLMNTEIVECLQWFPACSLHWYCTRWSSQCRCQL